MTVVDSQSYHIFYWVSRCKLLVHGWKSVNLPEDFHQGICDSIWCRYADWLAGWSPSNADIEGPRNELANLKSGGGGTEGTVPVSHLKQPHYLWVQSKYYFCCVLWLCRACTLALKHTFMPCSAMWTLAGADPTRSLSWRDVWRNLKVGSQCRKHNSSACRPKSMLWVISSGDTMIIDFFAMVVLMVLSDASL